jgi:hypothetical protein
VKSEPALLFASIRAAEENSRSPTFTQMTKVGLLDGRSLPA